jgi:hypothetical protein
MAMTQSQCPFVVGELVRFTPSERTRGLYQGIEGFGIQPGDAQPIAEIRNGCYIYFANGAGGWPWNEFTRVE